MAHNHQDLQFLNNITGHLNASVAMARDHLSDGQNMEVASLAGVVLASHANQLADALALARTLGQVAPMGEPVEPDIGPEVDGTTINKSITPVATKGTSTTSTSTGTTAGSGGGHGGSAMAPGQSGPGRSALAFNYEERAALTGQQINNLPDSQFAYIEPGGKKDASGKTVPRSKRHFPIHDAAHVRNALARAPQSPFGKQAMPKILAAAKKFGIETSQSNSREPGGEAFRMMPFEMRSTGSDGLTLEGYAAVFNSRTQISSWEGDFEEQIAPGAFTRSLAEKTPVLMFEHGKHPLIGTMPLGVIKRAAEDSNGLHVEARLSDNWLIQPVRDAVRDGAVSGMSFRFSVPKGGDTWERRKDMPDLRTVTQAKVVELGPVVFPAYEPTTAHVRSSLEVIDFTGQPETWSLGGSDADKRSGSGRESISTINALIRDRELALRIRGLI